MDEQQPLIEEVRVSTREIAAGDEDELIMTRTSVIEQKLNFPNPQTVSDVFEHGKIKPTKSLVYLKPVSFVFRFSRIKLYLKIRFGFLFNVFKIH